MSDFDIKLKSVASIDYIDDEYDRNPLLFVNGNFTSVSSDSKEEDNKKFKPKYILFSYDSGKKKVFLLEATLEDINKLDLGYTQNIVIPAKLFDDFLQKNPDIDARLSDHNYRSALTEGVTVTIGDCIQPAFSNILTLTTEMLGIMGPMVVIPIIVSLLFHAVPENNNPDGLTKEQLEQKRKERFCTTFCVCLRSIAAVGGWNAGYMVLLATLGAVTLADGGITAAALILVPALFEFATVFLTACVTDLITAYYIDNKRGWELATSIKLLDNLGTASLSFVNAVICSVAIFGVIPGINNVITKAGSFAAALLAPVIGHVTAIAVIAIGSLATTFTYCKLFSPNSVIKTVAAKVSNDKPNSLLMYTKEINTKDSTSGATQSTRPKFISSSNLPRCRPPTPSIRLATCAA
jgi:hypothetical protein